MKALALLFVTLSAVSSLATGSLARLLSHDDLVATHVGPVRLFAINLSAGTKPAAWFVADGSVEPLPPPPFALATVVTLAVSPKKKLAILSAGEGHPVLHVASWNDVVRGQATVAMATIDPYPGSVAFDRWDGETLLVRSDVPLDRRSADGRVPAGTEAGAWRHYRWEPIQDRLVAVPR